MLLREYLQPIKPHLKAHAQLSAVLQLIILLNAEKNRAIVLPGFLLQ